MLNLVWNIKMKLQTVQIKHIFSTPSIAWFSLFSIFYLFPLFLQNVVAGSLRNLLLHKDK